MQMDSRNAQLAYKRKQMAESQQRRYERRMRHIELQAAQKSEAATWAKELEKNGMTSRDLLEEMEIQRRTSRDVPYVNKTLLPPSEAETMQTVSYKDLYKRLKKPDALATAQTLSAPMSPPAHSRHDATGSVAPSPAQPSPLTNAPQLSSGPTTFNSDSTSSFLLASVTVSMFILPALPPLPPLSIIFPPPLLDFDRDQRDRSRDCDRNDRDRVRDCRKGKANGRRKEHPTFLAALHSNSTESSFIQAFIYLFQRMSRLGTTFFDKNAITQPTGSIQCQVLLDTGSLARDFISG